MAVSPSAGIRKYQSDVITFNSSDSCTQTTNKFCHTLRLRYSLLQASNNDLGKEYPIGTAWLL